MASEKCSTAHKPQTATKPHAASGMSSDAVIDARIGRLLQTGTFTSAAVVLGGGIYYLIQNAHTPTNFHQFVGEPTALKSIPSICVLAFHGDAIAIIQLGLLLLIATPISRVAFSIIAFALQKDLLYVAVSAIVLCVLLYGLIWH